MECGNFFLYYKRMLSHFNGMSIAPEIESGVNVQTKDYVDLCFIHRKFVASEY
jgi:hypothetical protein